MPSQPYNLVKDEPDLRVPLHSDESFYNGITFQAKVSYRQIFNEKIIQKKIASFISKSGD
jgi:hypothetical protein